MQTLAQTIEVLRSLLDSSCETGRFDHVAALDAVMACEPSSLSSAFAYLRENRATSDRLLLFHRSSSGEAPIKFLLEGDFEYRGAIHIEDKTLPCEIQYIDDAPAGSPLAVLYEKLDITGQQPSEDEVMAAEEELTNQLHALFAAINNNWEKVREDCKRAIFDRWRGEELDIASAKHWNGDTYRWTSKEAQREEAREDFGHLIDFGNLEKVSISLTIGSYAVVSCGFFDLRVYTDYFRFTWDGKFIDEAHDLAEIPVCLLWISQGKYSNCNAEYFSLLNHIKIPDYSAVTIY